jgi:Sec-independent protein translocase protein TatA
VLLVVVIVMLVLMYKKIPGFKKELTELYIATKDALMDGKLSDEEKEKIRKEWKDIDWGACIKELFTSLTK